MTTHTTLRSSSFSFSHALAAVLVSAFILAAPATADANGPTRFACEIAVPGPTSVRAAYEEYYACTEPIFDDWLRMYPAEVTQLQQLYQAWQAARTHDLRDQKSAARWSRQHPVNFSDSRVELSSAQVEELAPRLSGEPVQVAGAFERLFVDRDNRRLFLTTEEEGLVSIGIAARYAFELEGKVGQGGARDFFIYDDKTALVEERSQEGGNRDLVVLDISNREKPREVMRLRGVLPEVGGQLHFSSSMLEAPPTFDQYRVIREGRMTTSSCGVTPTVSTHPGIHCRTDGSCYRQEVRNNADEGICERLGPASFASRPPLRGPRSGAGFRDEMVFDFDDSAVEGNLARPDGERLRSPQERSAPTASTRRAPRPKTAMPVTPSPSPSPSQDHAAEGAPQGGAGGAGSLSQMMVFGETLYVLSGAQGISHGWLTTFDLSRPHQPRVRHVIQLDNGPEALQRHDNLLLVAGRDAVVTASLGVSSRPRLLGEFRQNCPVNYDPIVVQGTVGYRTIIVEGRRINCTSRLEVIDLSQPHKPVLRATYPIQRPRGLAVLGERLFVADEYQGVVLFDITDPVSPVAVGTWPMQGVKDLVLSDFDLYAMTGGEIQTFYVGPLFEREVNAGDAWRRIEGHKTVMSVPKAQRAEHKSFLRRVWDAF